MVAATPLLNLGPQEPRCCCTRPFTRILPLRRPHQAAGERRRGVQLPQHGARQEEWLWAESGNRAGSVAKTAAGGAPEGAAGVPAPCSSAPMLAWSADGPGRLYPSLGQGGWQGPASPVRIRVAAALLLLCQGPSAQSHRASRGAQHGHLRQPSMVLQSCKEGDTGAGLRPLPPRRATAGTHANVQTSPRGAGEDKHQNIHATGTGLCPQPFPPWMRTQAQRRGGEFRTGAPVRVGGRLHGLRPGWVPSQPVGPADRSALRTPALPCCWRLFWPSAPPPPAGPH